MVLDHKEETEIVCRKKRLPLEISVQVRIQSTGTVMMSAVPYGVPGVLGVSAL